MWEILALKFLLPILLKDFVASGVMTQVESDAITSIKDLVIWIRGLRTYSSPSDFPSQNQKGQPNFSAAMEDYRPTYPTEVKSGL